MRIKLLALLLLVVAAMGETVARAAVVIVSNRADSTVRFTIQPPQGEAEEHTLQPGDLIPIPVADAVALHIPARSGVRRYLLEPNAVYFLAKGADGVTLHQILAGNEPPRPAAPPGKLIVPVKLLVDDDEPTTRRVWEDRLRKRLQAASAILERHCLVRFEVEAVETWKSSNEITEFVQTLEEFERVVQPRPAWLAIGFTSQYPTPQEPSHLGGTRPALHSHILIREWYPRSEPERLEVLVHELGHYLGAAHSPEPGSAMRPKLGDGQAAFKRFRIGFDPLNSLAMSLVGEEVRTRGVRSLRELSPATREQLGRVYREIARALPDDPTASELLALLASGSGKGSAKSAAPGSSPSLAEPARRIVQAVVRAAERNHRLPRRLTGDALTEFYIREAAAAARLLPKEQAVAAFLVGIGIAVDTSDILRNNPVTRSLCTGVESDEERRHRLEVLGVPTMRGRHDLAQHFVVSCALTALIGSTLAEAAGLLKEQKDMEPGGSGFSFADLCADLAGVAFADHLRRAGVVPEELATSFTVAAYLPDLAGLPEGLSREAFARAYGSVSDERFRAERQRLRDRILALPGYRNGPK
ncbi:MAG TPA: hypothetical protein VNK04_12195 [Gemmataceae bacterium]|nr:hypothetical protein [Gemmataceae bacterium]